MTQDRVSAIPDRLDSYAERATAMDAELLSTTASMRNRLEHFQARCTEPGFTVHASGLVDPVRSLAHECDTVDKQVGEVGGRFRMADSRWSDHGGSWHLSAFGALWSTIAEWVPAFVLRGFWTVGTMRVPSWLIGVLPLLPWVQPIWRDGVSSGPGSESLPTGTSRLGELLDSDPAAEAERHVGSQPQGRSRLGELLDREEDKGSGPDETTSPPGEQRMWSEQEIRDRVQKGHRRLPTPYDPNKDPTELEQCVSWARERRRALGGDEIPPISTYNRDLGAYNLIGMYGARELSEDDRNALEPGALIVWDRNDEDSLARHGHVAVFEGLGKAGILVSHANHNKPVEFYSWERVEELGLYVIPLTAVRAENVPAHDDEIRYDRESEIHSEQSPDYSNCTWYAAAAVKSFSGDTINIGGARSLGWAGSWAGNAREAERDPDHPYHDYIAGVNKTPAIGSVYCEDEHVAFVEGVELKEEDGKKKWKITLSEENYYHARSLEDGGGVFSDSEEIDVANYPEVRRWRREITIVEGQDDIGEFIHFNY